MENNFTPVYLCYSADIEQYDYEINHCNKTIKGLENKKQPFKHIWLYVELRSNIMKEKNEKFNLNKKSDDKIIF